MQEIVQNLYVLCMNCNLYRLTCTSRVQEICTNTLCKLQLEQVDLYKLQLVLAPYTYQLNNVFYKNLVL